MAATDQSDSPLFTLSPELRNLIYGHVFSQVEHKIAIKLNGGPNVSHTEQRLKSVKRRVILEDDEEAESSQLTLLLTCKHINAEASAIAFSNMSFLATKFICTSTSSTLVNLHDVEDWLTKLRDTFGVNKVKLVKRLILANESLIKDLVSFSRHKGNFVVDEYGITALFPSCGTRSTALQALSHIEEIVLHMDYDPLAPDVVAGASLVSLVLNPCDERWLLAIFPSLKKIIVRRLTGEQTSAIVDGHIVAADSGMRLRGWEDWE